MHEDLQTRLPVVPDEQIATPKPSQEVLPPCVDGTFFDALHRFISGYYFTIIKCGGHMATKKQSFTKVKNLLDFLIAQEPQILFNVLNKLPKMGVGRKVTRVTWNLQDSKFYVRPVYWTVTKVHSNEVRCCVMRSMQLRVDVIVQDMRSGKVWGTFCHRGEAKCYVNMIRGPAIPRQ